MILALAVATVIVIAMTLIHYEVLRVIWRILPRLAIIGYRARVLVAVLSCFVAHVAEIWLLAGASYVASEYLGFGGVKGGEEWGWQRYLYLATESYTTIGYSGLEPLHNLRIVAGAGSLSGLLLIAWSASFTYLAMQEYWPLHGRHRSS